MSKKLDIYVSTSSSDILIGSLFIDINRGKEVFSFSFDKDYISHKYNYIIDPALNLTTDRQYLKDSTLFGFLQDIIPDRWGKTLLSRTYQRTLSTYDYLTLISDKGRLGALRIKENDIYVGNVSKDIPSYLYINSLEQVSYQIEEEMNENIKLLLEPGSSLGGARPKANIYDNDNEVYIAKFPSKNDDIDVELFEAVSNDLASLCEINVPKHKLVRLSNKGSTLLLKRFDRNKNERISYISMMSMLGAKDGDSSSYSYLDILNVITTYSYYPELDKIELYKRLIFNILLRNGDDHLRNHGLIRDELGWKLSPAFDLTPTFDKNSLSLSIDGNIYDFDLDCARKISKYFTISVETADVIINNMKQIFINKYESIFKQYKASSKDIEIFRQNIISKVK